MSSARLSAQQISNEVFPTEEEALEALNSGRITVEEFELLLEYFYWFSSRGADSTQRDIPNLDLTAGQRRAELDELQLEQLDGLLGRMRSSAGRAGSNYFGRVRMYADQELTGAERSRDVYQVRIGERGSWEANTVIGAEYGRPKRFKTRTVSYTPENGKLVEALGGNFQLRRGGGLALGRRGRALARADNLDFESFLTPDRGGLNGALVTVRPHTGGALTPELTAAVSYQRSVDHRLTSLIWSGEARAHGWGAGVSVTRSRLTNRLTDIHVTQGQYSIYGERRAGSVNTLAELNGESNDGTVSLAGVVEARYQTGRGNVRGAFWSYPKGYWNLLGAGRSGIIYESVDIAEVDFTIRDRRVDQSGALLRSLAPLSGGWELETGLDLARQADQDRRAEYILALHKEMAGVGRFKLEGGGRAEKRDGAEVERWRARAQLTGRPDWGSWRAAAQVSRQGSRDKQVALFARVTRRFRARELELWANLTEWESGAGLKRFYGYLQYSASLDRAERLHVVSKLGYRYSASATVRSRVAARIELSASW
ncbi:MAG: hypothetical protein ACE5GA_01655 [Candidatus Zixiibacteriota bacterium]